MKYNHNTCTHAEAQMLAPSENRDFGLDLTVKGIVLNLTSIHIINLSIKDYKDTGL